MTERKYLASIDNGNQTQDFEFRSTHRAGSKANREDCMSEWYRHHGQRPKIEVVGVWLQGEDE